MSNGTPVPWFGLSSPYTWTLPTGPTTVTWSGVGFVPGPNGLMKYELEREDMLKYRYPIYPVD
jgi:hypothetical protein